MAAEHSQQRSDTDNVSEETNERNEFLQSILEDVSLDIRRSLDALIQMMLPNGGR